MSARDRRAQASRIELLGWVASIGAVSAVALAVREGSDVAPAAGRLRSAERMGLMRSVAPLREQPRLYSVSAAGLRACSQTGLAVPRIGAANAEHTATCAHVAARLQRAYPNRLVIGEPLVREEERRGGLRASCELGGAGPGQGPRTHRGDLAVLDRGRGGASAPIIIEVELTVKAPERLARICRAWARSAWVAGVVYVVAPAPGRAVLRAIERADAGERVAVLSLAAVLEPHRDTPA